MLLEGSAEVNCCPSSDSNWGNSHDYGESIKLQSIRNQYYSEENDIHEIDLNEFVNHLATELVSDSFHLDEKETTKTTLQKIKIIEYGYRNVMEDLSKCLNQWLEVRKNIITALHGAEVKFRLIHRTTASITFMASTFEMVARAGLILHDLFDFGSTFPFKIIPVLSGISLTSSLMALSYSKTALEDVSRDMRDEKRLHIDLETIYRKGNNIDDSVQKLFPHGIDLNLMNDVMRRLDVKKADGRAWKRLLCSVIVSTNHREDQNILEDESFLQTLKAFVQSNAAQLWLSRIKIRMLLNEMADRSKNLEKKELSSAREAFLGVSAINLYPAVFSLFFNNENLDKVRLISSAATAIVTAKTISGKEKDEFQDLRKTWKALVKEYETVKKMTKYALNDYE